MELFSQFFVVSLSYLQPLLLYLSSREVLFASICEILSIAAVGAKRVWLLLHEAGLVPLHVIVIDPVDIE